MFEIGLGLLLFGIIIFIHELGHYIAARMIGVRVATFSIGFGRRLIEKQIGDTLWCISAIPLGGYVRPFYSYKAIAVKTPSKLLRAIAPISIAEQEILNDFEKQPRGNLANSSFLAKLFFMSNGLILNVLSAYLALAISSLLTLQITTFVDTAQIGKVAANSLAAEAGFQREDTILAINGTPVSTRKEVNNIFKSTTSPDFSVTVKRGPSEVQTLRFVPNRPDGQMTDLGIFPAKRQRSLTPYEAFSAAAIVIPSIASDFVKSVLGIQDKDRAPQESSLGWGVVGGVIGIGVMASQDFDEFLEMFIVLSIGIVILNAVPYPAFDGGQILLLLIEKIRGEDLSFALKEQIGYFGLASSVLLTFVALGSDIYTSLRLLIFD